MIYNSGNEVKDLFDRCPLRNNYDENGNKIVSLTTVTELYIEKNYSLDTIADALGIGYADMSKFLYANNLPAQKNLHYDGDFFDNPNFKERTKSDVNLKDFGYSEEAIAEKNHNNKHNMPKVELSNPCDDFFNDDEEPYTSQNDDVELSAIINNSSVDEAELDSAFYNDETSVEKSTLTKKEQNELILLLKDLVMV